LMEPKSQSLMEPVAELRAGSGENIPTHHLVEKSGNYVAARRSRPFSGHPQNGPDCRVGGQGQQL